MVVLLPGQTGRYVRAQSVTQSVLHMAVLFLTGTWRPLDELDIVPQAVEDFPLAKVDGHERALEVDLRKWLVGFKRRG